MTDSQTTPKLRLGLLLWSAGLLGAAVITVLALPLMLQQIQEPLPAPIWILTLAGLAQSAVLLALAVWGGVRLAPSLGLRAPAFEAVAAGHPVGPAIRPQLRPGLIAGVLGGILMFTAFRFAPQAVAELQGRFELPIVARVLYGGITEELLLRWGLMTAVLWVAWRVLQQRNAPVKAGVAWLAITVSALLFASGHLPAAAFLVGTLDVPVVTFVMVVNTGFGVLFGHLYWRYGLESAIIAHAVVHLVNFAANLV